MRNKLGHTKHIAKINISTNTYSNFSDVLGVFKLVTQTSNLEESETKA
jgi:hypothetical protein